MNSIVGQICLLRLKLLLICWEHMNSKRVSDYDECHCYMLRTPAARFTNMNLADIFLAINPPRVYENLPHSWSHFKSFLNFERFYWFEKDSLDNIMALLM